MRVTQKDWGREIIWAQNSLYAAKILEIKKGHSMSLQVHKTKDETLYVDSGSIVAWYYPEDDTSRGTTKILGPGECIRFEPGIVHRFTAIEDCRVFEVSTPELDDMVRLADDYGRK
jgi:mannose-6-phosphate isomerase-like protein (cupin superfamily)